MIESEWTAERKDDLMIFGLNLPNYSTLGHRDAVIAIAERAEELGYSSLWTSDHILGRWRGRRFRIGGGLIGGDVRGGLLRVAEETAEGGQCESDDPG